MRSTRAGLAMATLLFVFAATGLSSSHAQGNPNPGVVPINEQYSTLSAQWWQWALSQQVATSPLFDLTGAQAANGQPGNGNLFFLAGLIGTSGDPLFAHAERTITIHAGTRLFFPILNSEGDNAGVDPPFTVPQLRNITAFFANQVTRLYATIDGRAVQNLAGYRTLSPVFGYNLPATDNLYQFFGLDVSGAQFPAVGDGYYLLLTPLSPGNHTLTFGGTTLSQDQYGNSALFHLDIVYHITVTAGKQ
jgi:hypothetical protein